MSKACQYATNDDKGFIGLKYVSVKEAQNGLLITITWTNFLGKGGENGNVLVLKMGCDIEN